MNEKLKSTLKLNMLNNYKGNYIIMNLRRTQRFTYLLIFKT